MHPGLTTSAYASKHNLGFALRNVLGPGPYHDFLPLRVLGVARHKSYDTLVAVSVCMPETLRKARNHKRPENALVRLGEVQERPKEVRNGLEEAPKMFRHALRKIQKCMGLGEVRKLTETVWQKAKNMEAQKLKAFGWLEGPNIMSQGPCWATSAWRRYQSCRSAGLAAQQNLQGLAAPTYLQKESCGRRVWGLKS